MRTPHILVKTDAPDREPDVGKEGPEQALEASKCDQVLCDEGHGRVLQLTLKQRLQRRQLLLPEPQLLQPQVEQGAVRVLLLLLQPGQALHRGEDLRAAEPGRAVPLLFRLAVRVPCRLGLLTCLTARGGVLPLYWHRPVVWQRVLLLLLEARGPRCRERRVPGGPRGPR